MRERAAATGRGGIGRGRGGGGGRCWGRGRELPVRGGHSVHRDFSGCWSGNSQALRSLGRGQECADGQMVQVAPSAGRAPIQGFRFVCE